MNNLFVVINGSFVPAATASLLVNDLSIQRGYGIFDFLRTTNGKFQFLDDHLDRFIYSAGEMRLAIGKDRNEIKSIIGELAERNNLPDSGIKLTLTGGYSPDGYSLNEPNFILTQTALLPGNQASAAGTRLVTYAHQRQLPAVKTIDYIMAIWLRPFIAQQNADEVLYHQQGIITECPRNNIFIVTRDNEVLTPATNILKGVTRKKLLELAATRFVTREQDISIDDVLMAKEVFVTSTTKQVLPVLQFNGQVIGNGEPGEVSDWLKMKLEELIAG